MSGPKPKLVFKSKGLTIFHVKGKTRQRTFTFVKEKGKIVRVKASEAKVLDDIANILPAATWRSKFAMRIRTVARFSIGKLAEQAKGALKKRLTQLNDSEIVSLVRKATRARQTAKSRAAAVNHADGLIRELDFTHEFDPATRSKRAAELESELKDRVRTHNKTSLEEWQEDIQYARRAYLPAATEKKVPPGEVGDLIAFVYSKKKRPQRIWILMIGNAKGASNAVALASKGGWYKPWSGEIVSGEFLGQPDVDLERIMELAPLDIPGHGTFTSDQIRVGPRSTLRIGVVPPDIEIPVRNELERFAKNKGQDMFRLWDSRIPKAESEAAADQLVDIIESADP